MGITAAFYSAIHYFEGWLFKKPEKHTETSIPLDESGKLKYSPHAWREKMVEKIGKDIFKSFRKLRDASETARYLSLSRIGAKRKPVWLKIPASEFFTREEAEKLIKKELKNLKNILGFRNNFIQKVKS